MITVTNTDIGTHVRYDNGHSDPEFGIIKNFNSNYVFVVYSGRVHAQATAHKNLFWVEEMKECNVSAHRTSLGVE